MAYNRGSGINKDAFNLSEERLQMIAAIAKAYYEQNATQQEIASGLGISRSQISRYLDKARELGIVKITVTAPDSHSMELEESLKERFSRLKNAIVVPFDTTIQGGGLTLLGRACAKFLQDNLRDGILVGIGAGRTVRSAVDWLRPTKYNIKVVQTMGSTGYFAQGVDYNELANQAASNLQCPLYLINAPTVLWKNTGTVEDLIAENKTLAERLMMSKNCNIYLLGIGAIGSDDLYIKSGMIEEEDLRAAREDGAVGNICASFFRQDGSICRTNFENRIIGVRIEDIAKAEISILVAAGIHKARPIYGALRGGFVNTLITDQQTALEVLSQCEDD